MPMARTLYTDAGGNLRLSACSVATASQETVTSSPVEALYDRARFRLDGSVLELSEDSGRTDLAHKYLGLVSGLHLFAPRCLSQE